MLEVRKSEVSSWQGCWQALVRIYFLGLPEAGSQAAFLRLKHNFKMIGWDDVPAVGSDTHPRPLRTAQAEGRQRTGHRHRKPQMSR